MAMFLKPKKTSHFAVAATLKRNHSAMVPTVKSGSRANNSLWAESPSEITPQTSEFINSADVAIIGGGFSGLWSAFHLKRLEPSLSIAIFEAQELGFGASGRNGGWASSDYPVYRSTLVKRHGRESTDLLFDSLNSSIDEIGDFARQYAPACGFVKSGTISFARNLGQSKRLQALVDEDHQWLRAEEVSERLKVTGVLGGIFNPKCATVQPFELLAGLARYLSNIGVKIYTNAFASEVPGGVLANNHFVDAPRVIRATEVFGKPGRDFIPLYSLMVATEPLGEDIWREIGAQERFTFAEASHLINYAQRTVDNRLAIGGRGATYPLGSTLLESKEQTPRVHENLRSLARSWFPVLNDVKFTHSWGGAVAITRDWEPYVLWNKETGRARLGGYAGDGVTMSYLAANTLAHEILEIESRFRKLHFVNRPIRQWEPEPLRYLAINSLVKLSDIADAEERMTRRPSFLSRIIEPLILR